MTISRTCCTFVSLSGEAARRYWRPGSLGLGLSASPTPGELAVREGLSQQPLTGCADHTPTCFLTNLLLISYYMIN